MAAKMSALPENEELPPQQHRCKDSKSLKHHGHVRTSKSKEKAGWQQLSAELLIRRTALGRGCVAAPWNDTGAEIEKLLAAADVGEPKRIAALCEAGVDIEVKDEYGQTALFIAATLGHASAVFILLSFGADPDAAAHACPSALHAAKSRP